MVFKMQAKSVRHLHSPVEDSDRKAPSSIHAYISIYNLPDLLTKYVSEDASIGTKTTDEYVQILMADPRNVHLLCSPITILVSSVTFDNRKNILTFDINDFDTYLGVVFNEALLNAALLCKNEEELFPEPYIEVEFIPNLSRKEAETFVFHRQFY